MGLGSLALVSPALVCEATIPGQEFNEEYAHVLERILPGGPRLVLGRGDGLVIEWDESGVGLNTEENAIVTVHTATAPFDRDSWER
jgi:hypothetical protein